MKKNTIKALALATAMACMLTIPVHKVEATSQGTKGDELQIMQAQQLEVRLGPEWAGEEFALQTDAGEYPGVVTVDEEGVLRMEVGGSSKYILTRLYTDIGEPAPPMEPDASDEAETLTDATEASAAETVAETEPVENDSTIAGIPKLHLALFGGGMIIAVASLIGLSMYKKKQNAGKPDEDEEL